MGFLSKSCLSLRASMKAGPMSNLPRHMLGDPSYSLLPVLVPDPGSQWGEGQKTGSIRGREEGSGEGG